MPGLRWFACGFLISALACAGPAAAQEDIVVARLPERSIAALVNRLPDTTRPKRAIALFAGHPGILRLRTEDGETKFDLRGNFLIRARRHWLDAETITVSIDAPDDEWTAFSQYFRTTPRYGEDLRALLDAVEAKYGALDWTAVGTSEGSVSAFHAARMLPTRFRRVILTASVFLSGRNGPGLSSVDWSLLSVPLLWVHHEDDPCRFTAYRDAQTAARESKAPLVTVRGGGPAQGPNCMARTQHGFIGIEQPAIEAMRAWIATGRAPEFVGSAAR
ncbi:MAG: hypothetical protein O2975_03600 [Proteobacteria bacterium]|nr:hypothetical protein [Pseudomonadota bacterium]